MKVERIAAGSRLYTLKAPKGETAGRLPSILKPQSFLGQPHSVYWMETREKGESDASIVQACCSM